MTVPADVPAGREKAVVFIVPNPSINKKTSKSKLKESSNGKQIKTYILGVDNKENIVSLPSQTQKGLESFCKLFN